MRRWLVSAILLTACAGGQTGEITELGACREPVGAAAIDAPSAAGRSAQEQLDELASSASTELAWHGAPASAVEVGFALTGEPGTLLGGSECARPWLAAPVTLTLRTADGALDESLSGTALFADTGAATVEATVLVRELAGALALDDRALDPEHATLHVTLFAERDALGGQLTLHPGTDGADDRALASF